MQRCVRLISYYSHHCGSRVVLPLFSLLLLLLALTTAVPAPSLADAAGHLTQLTFEAASDSVNPGAIPEATGIGGVCTRSTTNCATGSGCYRWNPSGQICNVSKALPTAQPIARAFARFRVAAFPTGFGGYDFMGLFENAFGTGAYVQFTNTDQLRVLSVGSGGATDACGPLAPHVAAGTWYAVRLRAQKSDSATVSLDLLSDDGVVLDSVTCTNQHAGGGNFTHALLGSGNGFGATADINIDDLDIHSDAAWPGNVRWTYLEPTANNSCSATMTGCSGTGNQWQCVDENPPSDGDATNLSAANTTACTFSHPTSASKGVLDPIHATLLWWNAEQVSGTVTLAGRLGTTDVAPQALGATYGNFFSLNTTNPANGQAWTATTLNSTAFGFRNTTAGTSRVSASRLVVGYEAATATPTPTPTPVLYGFASSFTNPSPAVGDAFASAIGTAAGYVIVGNPSQSKVYLYDHATGALLRTLTSPNPSAGDRFGAAVAGLAKNVIVGAPGDNTAGTNAGTVYLFDGITGQVLKTFLNPSPNPGDDFGVSVAAATLNVVIGADGDDTQGTNAGAAYVFAPGNDTQPNGVLRKTLYKPTPIGTSAFGTTVGTAGPYILVGDPGDGTGASGAGSIFVFDGNDFLNNNFGNLVLTIHNPFPGANDNFGAAVGDAAGDFLVGAPLDDAVATDAGAAYVFDGAATLSNGNPNPSFGALKRTINNPFPAAGDEFGASVSSAREAPTIIGAPFDDTAGTDAGAAYVFDGNGALLLTLLSPNPTSQAQFGAVVSGGRHILVGAPLDSSTASAAGRAYLWERGVSPCIDSQPSSVIGSWGPVQAWPAVAIHSIVTSEGKVLFFQGSDVWYSNTHTFVWDPAGGGLTEQQTVSNNLFCGGHASLADGREIAIGGTAVLFDGIEASFIFDPIAETWTKVASMAQTRWYATATTLRDGRILATSGRKAGGGNANIPEIYDPAQNTWTSMAASATQTLPLYPHMLLLPNGKVFQAGSDGGDTSTRTLNLTNANWSVVGNSFSGSGSSAMYLPGKVLKSGGFTAGPDGTFDTADDVITANAGVIDMTAATPVWRSIASMGSGRQNHNLTILPDGKVMVTGGSGKEDDPATAVLPSELWNPATEQWTRTACMGAPRMYHSGAVLLPDARVLVGGGNFYPSYQVYTPPYLYNGAQPAITNAPPAVTYGEVFTIETADAAAITSVAMIRPAAVTHAFNQNQRFIPLTPTQVTGGVQVTAPASADTAPPGYYMLFIVNNAGVPSVATFIQISAAVGCG